VLFISDLNSIITTQIANLVPKSKVSDKDFVTFCSIFDYDGELYLKIVTQILRRIIKLEIKGVTLKQ